MMNVKETLRRLHKRLPAMGLDELFELLDCYVEQSATFPNWEPNKVWCSTDKINCITSKNADPEIYTIATNNCTDGKIKFYDDGGSTQLVAEH